MILAQAQAIAQTQAQAQTQTDGQAKHTIWNTNFGEGTVSWLLFIFFGIALFFTVRWLLKQRHLYIKRMQPIRLFYAFASEIGLSPNQARQLQLIAKRVELTSPFTLVLSPRTLEHFTKMYLNQLSARQSEKVRSEINQIKHSLFDTA